MDGLEGTISCEIKKTQYGGVYLRIKKNYNEQDIKSYLHDLLFNYLKKRFESYPEITKANIEETKPKFVNEIGYILRFANYKNCECTFGFINFQEFYEPRLPFIDYLISFNIRGISEVRKAFKEGEEKFFCDKKASKNELDSFFNWYSKNYLSKEVPVIQPLSR